MYQDKTYFIDSEFTSATILQLGDNMLRVDLAASPADKKNASKVEDITREPKIEPKEEPEEEPTATD